MVGFEPTTPALRKRCSTVELHRQQSGFDGVPAVYGVSLYPALTLGRDFAIKTKKKPVKPHPDFPLFLHRTGQWAKKVHGKMHYFGNDSDTALDRWLAEKDIVFADRSRAALRSGNCAIGSW